MRNNNLILSGYAKINLLKCCFVLSSVLLLNFQVRAKNYYISSSSGNDSYSSTQAQNEATPWRSIAKLNSYFGSIVAGDNIYFKRGDVFYGTIVVTKSGTSGSPITISAYGSGNRPLLSGLITLSSWSSVGNGIYQAYAPAVKNTINLVTLNGTPQGVGRYPNLDATNGGYLTYESSSGTSSITDNQLSSSTNWTGAEVVIRKQHYLMEKCKITSHSGGTLNFTLTPSINPLNNDHPATGAATNGFGYFIQRDSRTLDRLGEWYFNTGSKNLQMHFGGSSPSSYSVRVSTLDTLINIGTRSYINVNNISFEGANAAAIYAANTTNLNIQSCDMNLMGGKGVLIFNSANILVDGVSTNNVLCGAIDVTSRYKGNATIRNCAIKNTALIAGMGSFWDDNDYKAISVSVTSGALVEYNSVENTGFVAIQFQGNNVTIKNNFVNYYDMVKDDGGGIYTYQNGTDANPGTQYTGRVIRDNIVMNGIGVMAGTNGDIDVDGIFLDGRTTGVDVLNNSVANIGMNGIFTNNSINVNIRGNTSFNNGNAAICISRYAWGSNKNLSIKQNIFYPKTNKQFNFGYTNQGVNTPVTSTIQSALQGIGSIDSNYYASSNPSGFYYWYIMNQGGSWNFPPAINFDAWKSLTSHDRASKLPAKTASSPDLIRFEYNATNSSKTVSLGAKYVGVDGTVYNGTITLNPYTSKILVQDGAVTGNPSSSLTASANVPGISCYGGNTTVTVSGSGGTAPYTGIGSYSVNTGKGSLKISTAIPVPLTSTLIYAPIGSVSSSKTYILRFSTLGTSSGGSLTANLRQTSSPYTNITSTQTRTFGTSRVDHEFVFTAPASQSNASFLIQLLQTSGTTYIDNLAFFEANSTGALISNNFFNGGQFESSISNVTTWSLTNNHTASLDLSGKITNTYYYPVKDATGAISTVAAKTSQPGSALTASSTAANIAVSGGTTTVVVSASGGTAPYTGTGSFGSVKAGTYNYTVKDANGCTVVTTITIKEGTGSSSGGSGSGSGSGTPLSASSSVPAISCFGGSVVATVSGSGGTAPYTGTGSYNVNAGTGTLKISVSNPVASNYTLIYSEIGAVISGVKYVLRFSTLGTTGNGYLKASMRQTATPWTTIATAQSRTFGTSRVDHEFIFTPTSNQAHASFLIEIRQSSGTVYLDNIACFRGNSVGVPFGNNLYKNGQFENSNYASNTTIWSLTNNHTAVVDYSNKISNTYYYTIKDAIGTTAVATVKTSQPAYLQATATAGTVTSTGGTTSITVSATGGTAPYTGTGAYNGMKVGTYTYTVRDAKGCTSVTTVSVKQNGAARIASSTGSVGSSQSLSAVVLSDNNPLKINTYPNPSNTEFGLTVDGGTTEMVNISVISSDGRIVHKTQGTSNKIYKFGNEFMPGLYVIKVIQGKTMQTIKIVKAK